VAEKGDGAVSVEKRVTEERCWRYDKLYHKFMLLYYCFASEEERAAMAEPNGWRPPIPTNVSLEEHVRSMQDWVDASLPQPPHCHVPHQCDARF
jgi:hypothetical protein